MMPSTFRLKQKQESSPVQDASTDVTEKQMPSTFRLKNTPKNEFTTEAAPKKEEVKEAEKKTSIAQEIGSGIAQFGLGIVKYFTWPLDVLKLAMQGEGLSDIDQIEAAFEAAGKPFDREKYVNDVINLTESVPTQDFLENLFKEKTGLDLAPQGETEKRIRQAGEIFGAGGRGILKETGKQLTKRAVGALAGTGTSYSAKEAGLNESLADLLGYGVGGAFMGKVKEAPKTAEGKKLTEIAQKHELREFQGITHEPPTKPLTVSKQAQEKATQELHETSKEAIDKIVSKKIPVNNLRKQGIDLEDVYSAAYDQADSTARSLSKEKVDTKNMVDHINKQLTKIKKSAPSLSTTDKRVMRELRKLKKDLIIKPKPVKSTLLGPNGLPLPVPKPKATYKKITPEQALDQYKNFNQELEGIYRKTEFTGSENAIKKTYGELKDELIKSIEKTSPELGKELKYANHIFHETSKLNTVESIMEKSFKNGYDPAKLVTTLGGKKNKAFLERSLGKDAVKDLVDIAAYGKKAEQKLLKSLRNPKTVSEYLAELTPVKVALLTLKRGVDIPLAGSISAMELGEHAINRIRGNLFLSPITRKSYIDFLHQATNPQSPLFKKASRELSDAIIEEFGSEENLLKESKTGFSKFLNLTRKIL